MLRKKETLMTIDFKTGAILEKMEIITLMNGTKIQKTIDEKTGTILKKKVIK